MEYQKVDCNHCGQEFEIKELHTRRLQDGVDEMYFVCPHCQHEFTSAYTNMEIRYEMKKIQNLYKRFRNAMGLEVKERIGQLILESKEKLGKMMDELRQTMNTENGKGEPL